MSDCYSIALSEPAKQARAHAFALECAMREKIADNEMSELSFDVRHFFGDDVYVRALFLPAGSFVVGKIHKHEHLSLILCGDISIVDESGATRLTGYQMPFTSRAGVKRAVAVHADTWYLTIHRKRDFDETDEEEIERAYVAESEEEFQQYAMARLMADDAKKIEVTT